MAKIIRNYRELRQHQTEISKSDVFRDKGGQIRDDNPPCYTGRTYTELAKIKMPLILDEIRLDPVPPEYAHLTQPFWKPWTVEEVIHAMEPAIRAISSQYTRRRSAFQADEAESLGKEAVLAALWTDLGLAWFAGYCYEKIEAAIRRGAKTSGIIRASERKGEYRDKVRSTDDVLGEGDNTLAETIPENLPLPVRERCGDYWLDGKRVCKGTNDAIFIPTCNNGKLESGEICDRCKGTGRILLFEERTTRSPMELAAERMRVEEFQWVFRKLTDGLSERQIEVLLLKEGLDPNGHRRDAAEVAAILKERHGMGSKNRVVQILDVVYRRIRSKQACSKELTEAIDRILDPDYD